MKKLVSLLIALILIVSMLSVTAVAFAEEAGSSETGSGETGTENPEEPEEPTEEPEEPRTVEFNKTAFLAAFENAEAAKKIKGTQSIGKFMLYFDWLLDPTLVQTVFPGINYALKNAEGATGEAIYQTAPDSDKIGLEFCNPSKDYKEEWSSATVGKEVTISSVGWYSFRFVVRDGSKQTEVLVKSSNIDIYFADNSKPEISGLSTDMENKQKDGILVGDTYAIKTNVSVKDDGSSSWDVNYVVKKYVKTENGERAWVQIYDSVSKKIEEGYENCISSTGVITMLEEDVLPEKGPIYSIVYTAVDRQGYKSDEKTMTLFGKLPEKDPVSAAQVWKIILYVVAGLAAVGIVVVLLIKPAPASKNDDSDNGSK